MDRCVRSRKEERLVAAVFPSYDVGRATVRPVDLENLAVLVRLPYMVALDDDPVPNACLHGSLPSFNRHGDGNPPLSVGPKVTPAPAEELTQALGVRLVAAIAYLESHHADNAVSRAPDGVWPGPGSPTAIWPV